MSIRYRILLGCLSLTLITVLMGGFSQRSQQETGEIATRIYDEAFLAVSYLREAQNALMKLSLAYAALEANAADPAVGVTGEDAAAALLEEAGPEILDSLSVAHERAMSPEGEAATAKLQAQIEALGQGPDGNSLPTLVTELAQIQTDFDTVVEIFAGDGFLYRKSVGDNIEDSAERTWVAMGFSVVVAFLITFMLNRSIVPPLREVVRIAKAIAAGRLDNVIASRDRSETGEMLDSLQLMQQSIVSNLEQINALMAEQASSHAGEMAVQHGRLQAALDNMTQGLCLFDAEGRLTVFNWRFGEMFGIPEQGVGMGSLLAGLGLDDSTDEGTVLRDLPDGRIIAIAHSKVEGGGWVATYEDVTERRRVEARFAHMARHDTLTGLPNRMLFREHMEEALSRGRGKHLSVLSLDLDGFKAINDTLGHPTGDAVLQQVAKRLKDAAPEADIMARLGGDEFVVIQGEGGDTDISALAQRLVDALHVPFEIGAHQLVIGVSIGIGSTSDVADLGEAGAPDTLLKNADLALYRAKGDGRGTYRFFEMEMDARLQARRRVELDLQTALEGRQFELLYQPLVDTRQARVAGFEALLRWHHPERGMVSPVEFIPVAEETGLIKAIGAWVLEEACRQATTWPENTKIAINLSPVQFNGGTLVETVAQALKLTGLDPSRLELEITESLLLQDSRPVLETLHQLRQLGVRIAMDDFGTGYSSLSYLQRFPFDKIKIDQAFIRQLSDNMESTAIVRAVIGLGRSLGMSILAEGVETAEQLAILQAEGCWDVQGYFFSPPSPADETHDLILSIAMGQVAPPKRKGRSAA